MARLTAVCAAAAAAAGLASAATDGMDRARYGAVAAVPDALLPRYIVDSSFPIAKRVAGCDVGYHSCHETGFGDQCCKDDSYCYVNRNGDPRCCPMGSNCVNDSPCNSESYYCTMTMTTTEDGQATETEQAGCCGRKCAGSSQYLCASDLGGACCGFGSECHAGGACVNTVAPSHSPALTPVAEGCTTSQYQCDDGQGCCDNDQVCTEVSNTAFCAAGTPTPSGADIVDADDVEGGGGDGLSDGAKAGIGVGVVVGASIIIGGLTWLCLRKRRDRRHALAQTSGPGVEPGGSDVYHNQYQPDDAGMTDVSGSRPQPGRGLTQEYFGPDPVAGPFTESDVLSVGTSPHPTRAVPSAPQQPGDITAPVEIDSTSEAAGRMSPTSNLSGPYMSPMAQAVDGRYELYGSEAAGPDHQITSPQLLSPLTPQSEYPRSQNSRE